MGLWPQFDGELEVCPFCANVPLAMVLVDFQAANNALLN